VLLASAFVAAFESGRRLCLLFEAGQSRYAVEATRVLEVAPPDPRAEDRLRGGLELMDLSRLLGGAPEVRPGMAVVLDVSPTLAIRVKGVLEVADLARAPTFQLPTSLGDGLALLVRGTALHKDQLYLELVADALPSRPEGLTFSIAAPHRPVYTLDQPPEKALIFESQSRLYGVPLAFVSQVVASNASFCPMPGPSGGPVAGLFPHAQFLWPIFSAPGLLGASARREELFVLTDLAGHQLGLCASRVLGVHGSLRRGEGNGELLGPTLPAPAIFLDLQRMFS
jgi:chemotaxis signal transduction protein